MIHRFINKNHSSYTLYVSIAVASIILLLTILYFFPRIFPTLASAIARPFWRIEFAIDSGAMDSNTTLFLQNAELQRQIARLEAEGALYHSLQSENESLRKMLGLDIDNYDITSISTTTSSTSPAHIALNGKAVKNINKSYILTAVLSRPPFAIYDEIVIDNASNFSKGDTVYLINGIPVGKIVEILGQTSKAQLFSSSETKIEVNIGADNIPATAIGMGGGQYYAELPRSAKIVDGDAVYALSLGNKPIGIVTGRDASPEDAFQRIFFAPPENIYQLRWVLVQKNEK